MRTDRCAGLQTVNVGGFDTIDLKKSVWCLSRPRFSASMNRNWLQQGACSTAPSIAKCFRAASKAIVWSSYYCHIL